jgi:ornithine cyclodeaminase/alanine dehydrogenase-like protein (mu-crystallin family)
VSLQFDDAAVRRLLRVEDLIPAVRQALIALSAGRVQQPQRIVLELASPGSLIFVKPVVAPDVIATKIITQVPANAQRGLPTMLATILLMDPSTGSTLAIMDGTWLTALRTAAVSAVGADALTPPGPKIVALLGSGVLARTHALALRAVRPVSEIRVWSRNADNVRRCAEEIDALPSKKPEEAVEGADIICTVTNASEPVLRGAWLKHGAFVAGVGAVRPTWRELDDDVMRHTVIADRREAAETESGDVILSGAKVYAELGEILGGSRPPPPAGATVVLKALGQAVTDAAAARLVYDAARRSA